MLLDGGFSPHKLRFSIRLDGVEPPVSLCVKTGDGSRAVCASNRNASAIVVVTSVVADETLQPVIVIEIVSPGNPENDYIWKVEAYARMGIPEYWIVDPGNDAVTFLVLTTEPQDAHYVQISASSLLPALNIVPTELIAGL